MSVASPFDVARVLVARGATPEAEIVLRGALARGEHAGESRIALATLQRGGTLAPGPMPALDLELVDRWIREGLLVEALAVLVGVDLGGPAEEWANLLGELLAPVPAHAEEVFVQMHREVLSGGASLALTILEDRARQGALPGWADRRLALLRWMLLDNAEAAPEDQAPTGIAPSALAAALRVPLHQRSVEGMHAVVSEYARAYPSDPDARALLPMTTLLANEMVAQLQMDLSGFQTVPVSGRPAAAMQLRMGNLDGAASIYRSLVGKTPGDARLQQLADAVRGLQRVLDGRPVVDRNFAPPVPDAVHERQVYERHADGAFAEPTRVVGDPLPRFEGSIVERRRSDSALDLGEGFSLEGQRTAVSSESPCSPTTEDEVDEPTIALARANLSEDLTARAVVSARSSDGPRSVAPRPVLAVGARPPTPSVIPRSETEMKRLDDPDPTVLMGPPTVVMRSIHPVGVESDQSETEEAPSCGTKETLS